MHFFLSLSLIIFFFFPDIANIFLVISKFLRCQINKFQQNRRSSILYFQYFKMEPVVKTIAGPLEYGASPFWYPKKQSLYFVNVYRAELHKYNPQTNEHVFATIDGNEKSYLTFKIWKYFAKFWKIFENFKNKIEKKLWGNLKEIFGKIMKLQDFKENLAKILRNE